MVLQPKGPDFRKYVWMTALAACLLGGAIVPFVDIAPSFYPRLSSLWRSVWPILAVAGASWAGAELRIERSA